jgi:phage head maturation protease
MPRLEGSIPLKFNGVVIGRAHVMSTDVDKTGLTVNLYLDDSPGMLEAIIAMVEVDAMPSMSFAFDQPSEQQPKETVCSSEERENDCPD